MKKEEKIKELENMQIELQNKFADIIAQPISDASIRDAETTGTDIISEWVNNSIIINVLNLSDTNQLKENNNK